MQTQRGRGVTEALPRRTGLRFAPTAAGESEVARRRRMANLCCPNSLCAGSSFLLHLSLHSVSGLRQRRLAVACFQGCDGLLRCVAHPPSIRFAVPVIRAVAPLARRSARSATRYTPSRSLVGCAARRISRFTQPSGMPRAFAVSAICDQTAHNRTQRGRIALTVMPCSAPSDDYQASSISGTSPVTLRSASVAARISFTATPGARSIR